MTSPSLQVRGLTAGYGSRVVLRDVNLDLDAGEMVAVIGANGSGRSTLLQALMGLAPWQRGEVRIAGRDVAGLRPEARARAGLSWVPEHRAVFGALTVEQNLLLGLRPPLSLLNSGSRWKAAGAAALEQQYATFPALAKRRYVAGAALSGGEQQMLAVARALIAEPRVLLTDEPFEGLAPAVVAALSAAFKRFCELGGTVLLVEQRNHAELFDLVQRRLHLQKGELVPE